MKKILNIIILFFFIASGTSDAGIFKNDSKTDRPRGGFYQDKSNPSGEAPDENYGGFFRKLTNDPLGPGGGPGGRPDSGEGIGQEAPLGDGRLVLFACCSVWVIIRSIAGIRTGRFKTK